MSLKSNIIDVSKAIPLNDKQWNDYQSGVGNLDFLPDAKKWESNIYSYKGKVYYFIASIFYDPTNYSSPSQPFCEDYYHPGHVIVRGNATKVVTNITASNTSNDFDPDDTDSWMRLLFVDVYYTNDIDKFEDSSLSIYSKYDNNTARVAMTESQLQTKGFILGKVNKNIWFHNSEIDHVDKMLPYRKFNNLYYKVNIEQEKRDLKASGYTPAQIQSQISKSINNNIKFGVYSPTYKIFEGITNTFGIEIETCLGRIEDSEVKNINVKAVHDGSLRDEDGNTPGGEYVSGVLVGDAGMAQVYELCRLLSNKCKINHQCGNHVHVGGLEWSKEDIVYSYILAEKIEAEMYTMLPKSRRSNTYCRALTPVALKRAPELCNTTNKSQYNIIIEDIFNDIFVEVTHVKDKGEIISNQSYNKDRQHPLGAKCGYDKATQRYCWLNYVTLLYNTKGANNSNTLEVRSHSGTTNYNKMKNWIKIWLGFCRYVETNKSSILNETITLAKMVKSVYPKTGDDLVKYIEERKEVFKTHSESIDYAMEETSKKTLKEVACA